MARLPIGGWTLLAAGSVLAILSAPVAVTALLLAARIGASRGPGAVEPGPRDALLDALETPAEGPGGACILFAADGTGIDSGRVAGIIGTVARGTDLVLERSRSQIALVARGVAREVDLAALVCRCQAAVEDRTGAKLSAGLSLSSRGIAADAVLRTAERALDIALARGPGEMEMVALAPAPGPLVEAPETSPLLETWIEPRIRAGTNRVCTVAPVPRWRHPALGLLDAGDIFDRETSPEAAATLLLRLLVDGLAALDRLDAAGLDVEILSMALAPGVGGVSGLAARLAFAIDRADIAPERIELRLSEPLEEPELAGLARIGCRIAAPPEIAGLLPERFGGDAPAVLLEAASLPPDMHALPRTAPEIIVLGVSDIAAIADLAAAGATQLHGPAISDPQRISELANWLAARQADIPARRSSRR